MANAFSCISAPMSYLVPGAMLDLKSMQEAGEKIYNIPVSDKEVKNVVESVYGELPEVE